MTRRIPFVVFLMAAALVALAASRAARAGEDSPYLRASATVVGEIVRIGDLVGNAGAVADVPIFRSPDLGQTGSVPAAVVIEAVRPHHIIGLETRGLTEVQVKRASRPITAKDLEDQLLRALAGKYGLTDMGKLAVTFDNDVGTIEVDPRTTQELGIGRLAYDTRSGRFDVTFDLPAGAAPRRQPLRFTGSVSETFDAVVPAHDLTTGQALQAADVTIARRPKTEFGTNPLVSVEQIQGYSLKHSMRAGQAIHQADLAKPELVGRNETVTIVYQVPGITLTVIGKSIEPGALGDTINVLNVQSKRTIQATVIGPNRVSVAAGTRLAADTTP